MKFQTAAAFAAALGLASASPVRHHARDIKAREVPQEHSHNVFLDIVREFLALDNPLEIQDPVFGLLGNAAAAAGAGKVTNLDCLHQATADQAFTNAKKKGDVRGMAGALVFQAIERNTGKVGLASVICNETAVNPEIAALKQHQDPASPNAAAINKGITLTLAQQLAAIGADPLLALESGTFAPGSLNDNTGKGNACDTADDEPGCIFSEKLLILDASIEEIQSAVADVKQTFTGTGAISATDVNLKGLSVATVTGNVVVETAAAAVAATTTEESAAATSACDAAPAATSSCTVITTTVAACATEAVMASMGVAPAAVQSQVASGTNVQAFTGTLGGAPPPVISTAGDRPFNVAGDTFVGIGAAVGRSCDKQHNACADAANQGQISGGVAACDAQNAQCHSANNLRRRAAEFGSCSDPTIVFKAGLDGRNTEAFIASNQNDFNHGSALKIGVIADFICQRLGSTCKASNAVQSQCEAAATAAKAATQDQTAADVFNNALVGGAAAAAVQVTSAPAVAATPAPAAMVMTITSCS